MDLNDDQTADAVAEPTSSPDVTEGTSSSEVVDNAPESPADAIRKEFMEKWGEDEPGEPDESEEAEDAPAETDEPEADTDTAKDTQKSETDTSDDAEDDAFRIPDDEFKALPAGVKQRLGHLNAESKKAKRELAELNAKLEPLQDKSERFDQLQTFVQENNIESTNVTLAFNAMAELSKGNFQGFIDLVQPWYDQAMQATGKALPPTLQQRVDDGYLTMEDAQELAKATATSQYSQAEAERMRKQQQEQKAQNAAAGEQQRAVQAIDAREAHYKSVDPDYAHKSPAIASVIRMALENGAQIKTSEDAVKLVDQAYKTVSETFKTPAAKPKPTPPRPTATAPARGEPEPTNTLEAITQGLRGLPSA